MRVQRDVYITMRDGTKIACCLYLPETNGACPALIAASPYQYEYDPAPARFFPWHEVGPVEWYTQKGYAYVHMDVRGTGRSGGTFKLFDSEEQRDYYEVIEWIAAQAWCTGKVGGIGQSYYGMAQWFMGIQNPPHLACIAPYDGMTDIYRDSSYQGGVYGQFFSDWTNMVRANNIQRPAALPAVNTMPYDLAGEMIRRQTYDDWWKERAALERLSEIKCPVLTIGVWGKMALHLRGNINGYEFVTAPKKLVVTGGKSVIDAHHDFNTVEFHERWLLPFYDRYLKGESNGYEKTAPVRLFVNGTGQYRDEQEWPPRRARYRDYYLSAGPSGSVTSLNDGALVTQKPAAKDGASSYAYPDPQWIMMGTAAMTKFGPDPVARILTFTSEPLAADLEVTGEIVLELFAESDQPDTDFIVKISEQLPQAAGERTDGKQPAAVIASRGWLKASHHRDKDKAKSRETRPFYTHKAPQPIRPGEVYKFEIEIMPTAYVFKKGSRIRLEIANGDAPMVEQFFGHQYHPAKQGRDTIHHSSVYPSRLLLPVIET